MSRLFYILRDSKHQLIHIVSGQRSRKQSGSNQLTYSVRAKRWRSSQTWAGSGLYPGSILHEAHRSPSRKVWLNMSPKASHETKSTHCKDVHVCLITPFFFQRNTLDINFSGLVRRSMVPRSECFQLVFPSHAIVSLHSVNIGEIFDITTTCCGERVFSTFG